MVILSLNLLSQALPSPKLWSSHHLGYPQFFSHVAVLPPSPVLPVFSTRHGFALLAAALSPQSTKAAPILDSTVTEVST